MITVACILLLVETAETLGVQRILKVQKIKMRNVIVFTIYKNGGNAGDFGASFSCVEMSANRGKNDCANTICFFGGEYVI